jgi:hypothetical protein
VRPGGAGRQGWGEPVSVDGQGLGAWVRLGLHFDRDDAGGGLDEGIEVGASAIGGLIGRVPAMRDRFLCDKTVRSAPPCAGRVRFSAFAAHVSAEPRGRHRVLVGGRVYSCRMTTRDLGGATLLNELEYPDPAFLQQAVAKLPWGHVVALIGGRSRSCGRGGGASQLVSAGGFADGTDVRYSRARTHHWRTTGRMGDRIGPAASGRREPRPTEGHHT